MNALCEKKKCHCPTDSRSMRTKGMRTPYPENQDVDAISSTDTRHFHSGIGNRGLRHLMASGRLMPKLRIGQPNDEYEQEADRIADQVMRMPEPGIQRKPG
jgi:hypothetical protein